MIGCLLGRALLENRQNFFFRPGGSKLFADGAIIQKLGDRRERAEVGLKLVLRHNEKDDEFDWRAVERIELDPLRRTSKGGDDLGDRVGGGMRNGDPKTDAGAHGFLPLFQGRKNAIPAGWIDFLLSHEQINQLDDGGPALGRLHLRNDLLGR